MIGSSRWRSAVLAVVVPLIAAAPGCDKAPAPPSPATSTGATSDVGSATAAPSSPPSARAPAAASASAPPTPEERSRLRAVYLARGRGLAGKKRWGDASRLLERAVALDPTDPTALGELSWSALNAGDLARARRAVLDALRHAKGPAIQAQLLYNLGRVEEAYGNTGAAGARYRASLALRPNAEVDARLAQLGKAAPAAETLAAPDAPCATPAKLDDLCCCLDRAIDKTRAASGDGGGEPAADAGAPEAPAECYSYADDETKQRFVALGPGTVRCSVSSDKAKLADRARMLSVQVMDSPGATHAFLAVNGSAGWSAAAELGTASHPGWGGMDEQVSLGKIEAREVSGKRVLWVETTVHHHDGDMGIYEVEEDDLRSLTLCVLFPDPGKPAGCPLQVPLATTFDRTRLPDAPKKLPPDVAELATPGLPIHRRTVYQVTLSPDGASYALSEGEAEDRARALLGPHKLW